MSSIAGRSMNILAGRDICNINNTSSGCRKFNSARIIYAVVISIVFLFGLALSVWLLVRRRRAWRRRQQLGLVYIPPMPNHNTAEVAPPYDPSLGRPVQNTGPGMPAPPPPTYSVA